LPDSFFYVDQCVVVDKDNAAKLAVIEKVVLQLRTSGFIEQSIARARLTGVAVVAPAKR
jgi:hypothetical protein